MGRIYVVFFTFTPTFKSKKVVILSTICLFTLSDFTLFQLSVVFFATFLLGLSKGGLKGLGMIYVLIYTSVFEAKSAMAIIVPLLIAGDLLALYWYKGHIDWRIVKQFLPWIVVGIFIGAFIGRDLSDLLFKRLIAVLVLLSLGMMWLWERQQKGFKPNFRSTMGLGLGAGIYSMLGNFAGVLSNIYFLSTRISKRAIIGTGTVVFFVGNIIKIPLHWLSWKTLTTSTLLIDLQLVPAVIIGFFAGTQFINYISEHFFRKFLYIITLLSALIVFF